jgi:hypothetical protein
MALSLQLTVQWVVVTSPAGLLYALPCLVGVDRPPCFVQACVLLAAEAAAVVDLLCTGTPAVLGHSCDAAVGVIAAIDFVVVLVGSVVAVGPCNLSVMVVLPVILDFRGFLVEMGCTPVLSTPVVCSAMMLLSSVLALFVVKAS